MGHRPENVLRGLERAAKPPSEEMVVETLLKEAILGIVVEPYGSRSLVSGAMSLYLRYRLRESEWEYGPSLEGSEEAESSFPIAEAVTDEGDRGYWPMEGVSGKEILDDRSPLLRCSRLLQAPQAKSRDLSEHPNCTESNDRTAFCCEVPAPPGLLRGCPERFMGRLLLSPRGVK